MPQGQIKDPSETRTSSDNASKKSIKDVTNTLEILESPQVQTNPFGANLSGENSYRRAERISAAVHLVTAHIAESEPLRIAVRQVTLRLLDRLLEMRRGFRAASSEKGQSALAEIRAAISLIRLLAVAGLISVPNAHALVEALDQLGNLIVVSQKSILAEQINLSAEDLVPRSESIYRTTGHKTAPSKTRRNPSKSIEKDTANSRIQRSETGDRAGRIKDILRAGGELGIKDIAANLPQYSEKMIQRELADMVDRGEVLRIGEKRWSKYRVKDGM